MRVTYRLTDSPSCLVSDEHDPSGNLARLMKAAGQPMPNSKPILEINPQHPAVMRLKYEESRFDDWAALLFEQATLAEGGQLDDPAGFVKRINDLMMALSGQVSRLQSLPGRLLRFNRSGRAKIKFVVLSCRKECP